MKPGNENERVLNYYKISTFSKKKFKTKMKLQKKVSIKRTLKRGGMNVTTNKRKEKNSFNEGKKWHIVSDYPREKFF